MVLFRPPGNPTVIQKDRCEYSLEYPTTGGPPVWGLGEVIISPNRKNVIMLRNSYKSLGIREILQYNLNLRIGTVGGLL